MPARAPAPRRKPAPRTRRRPQQRATRAAAAPRLNPAFAGAALIPHAAARTAGAISDLSESGLIMRLTRGRGWIALLCVLLGGIVTLNVLSLSYNATSGRVGQQIEELERQNSVLRGQLAEDLAPASIEAAAASAGLAVPPPEAVTYLTASDGDAATLAKLLGVGSDFTSDAPDPVYEDVTPVYDPTPEPAYTPPSTDSVAPPPSAAPPESSSPPSSTAPSPSPSGGTTGGVGL